MKKSLIAVFSISVTAGTLYLGYDQLKRVQIKKLIKACEGEATKRNKVLPSEKLKEELDKLFLWDLRLLVKISDKLGAKADQETAHLKEKIKTKRLMEKADLKSIEELILANN